jgi:NAD(P)-dependent dehydrogenase (short-subunit alcohol dehydrogenase family)
MTAATLERLLKGRTVLITGAARGIGAALAVRLHQRGARVGLIGLEPSLLAEVARAAGDAPWAPCNVASREEVDRAVAGIVGKLGRLDAVVANAGVAAQLPLLGGDADIFERTMGVNVLGAYYTIRAAGPHVAHPQGYALVVSSLAAAVHLPLMGAYCASKAAVEALGDCLRIEMRHTGARVGVAYFAEIATEMTTRGFGTKAAKLFPQLGQGARVAPLERAISALEHGIARRARIVGAPGFVRPLLPIRMLAQRVVELGVGRNVAKALEIAREEHAGLTTPQPG